MNNNLKALFRLPFPISVKYNTGSALFPGEEKTLRASHIEVHYRHELGGYYQLEIVDENGCVISPKRHRGIHSQYLKVYDMWKRGQLKSLTI